MSDQFPHPVSDPEAQGIPDVADDDSTAYDDVATGREADGPDPAAIPLDRDDRPEAIDRFGTTAEEQREGESLDDKVSRETPDPALRDVSERPDTTGSPIAAEAFDPDPLTTETDRLDTGTPLDATGPVDPRPDSPISLYDTGVGGGGPGGPDGGQVGRLVEPDEGAHEDTEGTSIATDAGAAGGGPSAEEAAIHVVDEP